MAGVTSYDTIIVGGGIAGGLAGLLLARAGARTLLLEKEAQAHHKVCGEFISGEGLDYLKAADIDLTPFGPAEVDRLRLTGRHNLWSRKLPAPGYGLSRNVLDGLLLERAAAHGCDIRRGIRAQGIHACNRSSSSTVTAQRASYRARYVILATGKHDLRSVQRRPPAKDDLVGLKMHLKLSPEQVCKMNNTIELFLFSGGYAGLTTIEDGLFNFCFVMKRSMLKKYGARWEELLGALGTQNPQLGERLRGSDTALDNMVSIAPIPYGFMAAVNARDIDAGNLFPVGDQLAVIPSLTGEGMTIAMLSATRAVKTILSHRQHSSPDLTESASYLCDMQRVLRPRMRWAMLAHHLFLHQLGSRILLYGGKMWPGLIDRAIRKTRCPAVCEKKFVGRPDRNRLE